MKRKREIVSTSYVVQLLSDGEYVSIRAFKEYKDAKKYISISFAPKSFRIVKRTDEVVKEI